MQAMKLTGIGQMEMIEVPTPELIHEDDVLIKIKAVGVCGSDVHYYRTGQIGSQVVEYPYAVGHEAAGVVEAVGPAVTRVSAGDRIAIEPAISCGTCDQCRAGRPHTCRELLFLGCPGQIEGCLSDYIVMPEASCFPLADGASFEEGALSEPLAIGVYAVQQSVPMKGAAIGILGAGPIGMSVLLPALNEGAASVFVTDKIEERGALAVAAGADWAGNPEREDVVAAITEREPAQLDVVFECCGEQEALDHAVALLKPGGKLMLIGIPPTAERVSFPIDTMRRNELCVQNVRRQNHCVQPALDLIARPDAHVGRMVTHRFPFSETQAAFDLVANYRDGVMKAMIEFD